MWNPQSPAVADIVKVRKTISKMKEGSVVRLGGMTDCFQPAERVHGVTYEAIKCLNEHNVGYLIVTKSALVAEDKYIAVLDKRLAHIQISITSTDDEIAKRYEKADPVSERIRAIEKLSALGFDVALRVSPYIPEYIDVNVINGVKCDKVLVEFLRANAFICKTFPIDYFEYVLKEGNYRHLPLEKKLEILSGIKGHTVTVCDDVKEHYEYFKENFNPNPDDCCNLRCDEEEKSE